MTNECSDAVARLVALQLRVRLWFVAWVVCGCATLLTLVLGRSAQRSYVSLSGAQDAALAAAVFWVIAGSLIRYRTMRAGGKPPRDARNVRGMHTAELASVWLLDCLVAVTGTVLSGHSPWIGLSVSATGVFLLSLTPPKIVSDADPP